jgi:hypothetical protein
MTMLKPAMASGEVAPTYTFMFQGCGGPSAAAETICNCWLAQAGPLYGNKQFTQTSTTTAACFYQLLSRGWWYGGTISGWNVPACPANSMPNSGGTCTCNSPTATNPANYVPDPTKTSCVPETFTVSLHGLGIEVMPNDKLTTAYAEVTKNDGKPKSGERVDLTLTVVPEEDGYNHAVGQHTAPHEGSLSTLGGATDTDGKLSFVFQAPVAGGLHTITAYCANCTNKATGTIKVPGCSVSDLTEVKDIPPNDPDVLPLTLELESTKGADLALLPAAQAGVTCIKNKFPSAIISSGTRTIAYQQHFIDIWSKMIELNKPVNQNNEACRPLRDKVIAEKGCSTNFGCIGACISGSHCLRHPPAIDSKHPKGKAFDVSDTTINGILLSLAPPPPPLTLQQETTMIADWLARPAACNLVWGGSFQDRVHFQIPD